MVDLLDSHRRHGRRFEPTEFIENGPRVAVGMTVSDPHFQGEVATDVFKVFTFAGHRAVLLQDCADRADALTHLAAE